jgi:hypothetical protein
VLERNACINDGAERIWQYARGIIREAVQKGYLPAGTEENTRPVEQNSE